MIGEHTCHNFGQRGDCLREPDPVHTMDFSDIGEGQLLWCSRCGPEAHELHAAFLAACRGDKTFCVRAAAAISDAEASIKAGAS